MLMQFLGFSNINFLAFTVAPYAITGDIVGCDWVSRILFTMYLMTLLLTSFYGYEIIHPNGHLSNPLMIFGTLTASLGKQPAGSRTSLLF